MIIENKNVSNLSRAFPVTDEPSVLIRNVNILDLIENQARLDDGVFGFDIRRCGTVDIEDVTVLGRAGMNARYCGAIRLGSSGTVSDGNTLVRLNRVKLGNIGPASSNPYTNPPKNRDILTIELGTGEVWAKDCDFSQGNGTADGIVDCKLPFFKATRTKFGSAYRQLRIWDNVTMILSECDFTQAPFQSVWFNSSMGKLILWKCTGLDLNKVSGAGKIEQATSNPLTDPWFAGVPVPVPDPALVICTSELAIAKQSIADLVARNTQLLAKIEAGKAALA